MPTNPKKFPPVFDDSSTDYLEPFIEASIAAAARFRRVLLVLIVDSVLAFSAFWNARPRGWLDSRRSRANDAIEYVANNDRLAQLPHELDSRRQKMSVASTSPQEYQYLEQQLTALELEQQRLQHAIANANPKGIQWITLKRVHNMEELKPILEGINKEHAEASSFHIPFFGTVQDINDLGLLSGFTFVIVLMWFRFSLWREYYNLQLAFVESKDEHLEYCYKAIAVRQVLTVPPNLTGKQPPIKPWGPVVRILYYLPVLVQLIVLANDCWTFKKGWLLSEFGTIFSVSVSLCFLVLSMMLSWWCFQLSRDIDKKWQEVATDIRGVKSKIERSSGIPQQIQKD